MRIRLPLLLALLALPACRTARPGELPRPRIEVERGGGGSPHRLSAAAIRPDDPELGAALARAGVGLRVAGERHGLLLRYAALDPAAESVLVRALQLSSAFSKPASFGPADVLEVRALSRPPESRGFLLHAVPGPDLTALEVGVVARPPDGAVLPVIRGRVPLRGSGALLLVGEAEGRPAFAALLRITLAGAARVGRVLAPRSHVLDVRAFLLDNDALAGVLRRLALSERGGEDAIAAYPVAADDLERLEELLAAEGDSIPGRRYPLREGEEVGWSRGRMRLFVSTVFTLGDFSYETVVTRRPPRRVRHGERDAILAVGWDAERPGRSVAAILRIRPEE